MMSDLSKLFPSLSPVLIDGGLVCPRPFILFVDEADDFG